MTDEVPSLWREIAKAAWMVGKVILGVAAVVLPIGALGVHHPLAGMIVLYAIVLGGMIGYFGWQNYRDKVQRQADRARERAGR